MSSEVTTDMVRGALTDMFGAFGRNPKPEVIEIYVDKLSTKPNYAVLRAVDHFVATSESLPKIAHMLGWIGSNFGSELIEYDKVEDHRFPIELLWRAYRMIERDKGKTDAAERFMESVNMPWQDRQAVKAKYHRAYRAEQLVEGIGLHDEL